MRTRTFINVDHINVYYKERFIRSYHDEKKLHNALVNHYDNDNVSLKLVFDDKVDHEDVMIKATSYILYHDPYSKFEYEL